MASSSGLIEQLLTQAAGPLVSAGLGVQLDRLTGELQRLQSVNQAAVESTRNNTSAVQASSQGSGRSVVGTILGALGSGIGPTLSPLLSGVLKLFGGGGSSAEPSPLVKFELPAARNVSAGIRDGAPGVFGVDYSQGGTPRPVVNSAPQITVQVQAMDSRSFLDHSTDIAMAVRQAMLESSVLQDVVREA